MDNKIDVVFTFDTTGSMYPCIHEVRQKVDTTCKKLFTDIKNLRIAIIAHGDYCDKGSTYVTKTLDFTNDPSGVSGFVKNVSRTGGGDADECYELVLNEAQSLNWRKDSQKVLVMIGDADPHKVGYRYGSITNKLDWKEEADKLRNMDVAIHGVKCLNNTYSDFYSELSRRTNGISLKLNQFSELNELIKGVCYKESNQLDVFEAELKEAGMLNRSIAEMLSKLSGKYVESIKFKDRDLEAVEPGRFQVLTVDKDCDIKTFVTKTGAEFKKGKGYYQFTKTETIQENKDVVLVDKETGDMYSGDKAREIIGLPKGTRGNLRPTYLEKWIPFVQSTSVNRKLIGGTKFLYEAS